MSKKIEWVLQPGTFSLKKKANQPGLDLSRAVGDFLKEQSLVVRTTDCCTYYPSFPEVTVVDVDAPTEAEMTNIPLKGLFWATDGTNYEAHRKLTASTTKQFTTT